jgi:hypothetical protein
VTDFDVYDHGSVIGFYCNTPAAVDWWNENVCQGMEFGGRKIVDHRCAQPILDALEREGFSCGIRP